MRNLLQLNERDLLDMPSIEERSVETIKRLLAEKGLASVN